MLSNPADSFERTLAALRKPFKDWGFASAFIATLALGLAANISVSSALNSYFFHPLPYAHGNHLTDISFNSKKYPVPPGEAMSAAAYEKLRSAPGIAKSGLASSYGQLTAVISGETPQNIHVSAVTASALRTLGVQPIIGRWITPSADRPGGASEVDISHGFWESAFNGNPNVLGDTLRVGGHFYTVVGVMPKSFSFPARNTQLWLPAVLTPADLSMQRLTDFNWVMIARLKKGVSIAKLDSQLDDRLTRLEHAMPPENRKLFHRVGAYITSMSLRRWLGGATRKRLLIMQVGAGILLLLSVFSLTNLALARALRRRQELVLRIVLGASRARLFWGTFVEALPLAVGAILIAWPLVRIGAMALEHYGIASQETSFHLFTSPWLWMVSLVASVLLSTTALVLPLAVTRNAHPASLLSGNSRTVEGNHGMRRLRLALSVGQIALAIMLLAGASFLGLSLHHMLNPKPGFNSRRLYAATLSLQGPRYRKWSNWHAAHERLKAAVSTIPEIAVSGIGEAVPFSGSGSSSSFRAETPQTNATLPHSGAVTLAGPDLMKALGVKLVSGRLLNSGDRTKNRHNLVVDERFAKNIFGDTEVVGKRLKCNFGTCRIVGVVKTIRDSFAQHYASDSGTVFVPEDSQTFKLWGGMTTIIFRSSVPRAELAREIRQAIHKTLPDQSLISFRPMISLIRDSAHGAAALSSLLIVFGFLAFTLAVIGTYGVISYVTGLRRREFTIRQALGAEPIQIEFMVLAQGLILWGLGALVGIGGAVLFVYTFSSELYHVNLFTPSAFAIPALTVGVVVMLASWLPAHRARRLDKGFQ